MKKGSGGGKGGETKEAQQEVREVGKGEKRECLERGEEDKDQRKTQNRQSQARLPVKGWKTEDRREQAQRDMGVDQGSSQSPTQVNNPWVLVRGHTAKPLTYRGE